MAAAAIVAATASARPTGADVIDPLWCAALAATITWAASRSRRWPWLCFAGIVAIGSVGSVWVIAAVLALLGAVAGAFLESRSRAIGAAIGALGAQALLRMPIGGFHGLATLLAVLAVAPLLGSAYECSPSRVRRRLRITAFSLGAVTVVATIGFGITAAIAEAHVRDGVEEASSGLEQIQDGKQDAAATRMSQAAAAFDQADTLLAGPWAWPARLVPIVAQHQRGLRIASQSGRDLTEAAGVAASTAPYQTLKASKGRVDLETVLRMQAPVDEAANALDRASERMAGIDTSWLLGELAEPIGEFQRRIDDARPEADTAAEALRIAPSLLGAYGDRTYLVLFTTPAETRFLGGISGSYGVLTAHLGKVDFTVSGKINSLLPAETVDTRSISGHDEYLTRFARYNPARNLQNLTASPDMPTDAEITRSLYEQATGQKLDGVIAVDPFALARLLKLTGPVLVPGLNEPLTSENAATYLLYTQYVTYGDDRSDRKDLLEAAGRATFEALTSRDLPGPREIADALSPMIDQKRLMAYPFLPDALGLFERLHTTAPFDPDLSTDYFSLRTANGGANKLDVFLYRSIHYDVAYDAGNGSVDATATISLRNDSPDGGLPEYLIGNANDEPLGTNTMYLSFYTPLVVSRATIDGWESGVEEQHEQGTRVFSSIVSVPPGKTVTVVLELHGSIPPGEHYGLDILNQPMVHDDELSLYVHAKSPAWPLISGDGMAIDDDAAIISTTMATDQRFGARFSR